MQDSTPYLCIYGHSAIEYGGTIYAVSLTAQPMASEPLCEKFLLEVHAIRHAQIDGMNAESSVEHVLGLKKGFVSKLLSPSLDAAAWKIELGVLLVYIDHTGQLPYELPISPLDMQRLEAICERIGYAPNRVRRQRFENYRSCHRAYKPEVLAARHRLDIELAASVDWMLLDPAQRSKHINDAFALNDRCFENRRAGDIEASRRDHIDLHEALTAPRWRESIRHPLELTISVIDSVKADLDPDLCATEDHRSHEQLIEEYASWDHPNRLANARTFIAERHHKRSPMVRRASGMREGNQNG